MKLKPVTQSFTLCAQDIDAFSDWLAQQMHEFFGPDAVNKTIHLYPDRAGNKRREEMESVTTDSRALKAALEGYGFTVFLYNEGAPTIYHWQQFKLCLLLFRHPAVCDGADRVQDVSARQIIRGRDLRPAGRLLISLRFHHLGAEIPKLDPGVGVDAVVDAGVHRHEAAQHLRVGGVHNGVNGQTGDIPLPDGHAISDHGNLRKRDNSVFADALPQVFILYGQYRTVQLLRHTNVHQRAQDSSFSLVILRRL